MPKLHPYLLLIGAGAAWGATPLLATNAALPLAELSFQRALFSAIFLCLMLNRKLAPVLRATRDNPKALILPAALSAISTTSFVVACATTKAAHVYLAYYMYPVYNLLISSAIARTAPNANLVGLVTLAFGGLSLLVLNDSSGDSTQFGDLMALLSGISWAGFIHYAQKLTSDGESMSSIIIGLIVTIILFGVFQKSPLATESSQDTSQWFTMIALGSLSAVALLAWGYAVRTVPGYIAGPIVMIEAPIGIFLMWLCFSQEIGLLSGVGGCMVLASALFLLRER